VRNKVPSLNGRGCVAQLSLQVTPMNIRRLAPSDIPKVIPLMAELGYPIDAASFAERVAAVSANPDDGVFLAEDEGPILGLVAVHSFEMLHRPGRLGRITALVVSASARNRGVGRRLLNAAESHLRAHGCVKLEVTSGEQRADAHGFYTAHGYVEQRVHFVKSSAT
jgi:GNAT superfamily N-acetyltransferase